MNTKRKEVEMKNLLDIIALTQLKGTEIQTKNEVTNVNKEIGSESSSKKDNYKIDFDSVGDDREILDCTDCDDD